MWSNHDHHRHERRLGRYRGVYCSPLFPSTPPQPISHFLPSFANPRVLLEDGQLVAADREITVRDLLTHTAGLGYGDGKGGAGLHPSDSPFLT